ncbi:Basic leucine zipper domain Maf-type [Trinorchestia longiramus]|nr:Basic leucine zipper domain Maf-type [Trinorchestia longiramus]
MAANKTIVITVPKMAVLKNQNDYLQRSGSFTSPSNIITKGHTTSYPLTKVVGSQQNKFKSTVSHLSNFQDIIKDEPGDSEITGLKPQRKRQRLDHLSLDQKIMRRKLKNRVAAQTARDRKKQQMDAMESRLNEMTKNLKTVTEYAKALLEKNAILEKQNSLMGTVDEGTISGGSVFMDTDANCGVFDIQQLQTRASSCYETQASSQYTVTGPLSVFTQATAVPVTKFQRQPNKKAVERIAYVPVSTQLQAIKSKQNSLPTSSTPVTTYAYSKPQQSIPFSFNPNTNTVIGNEFPFETLVTATNTPISTPKTEEVLIPETGDSLSSDDELMKQLSEILEHVSSSQPSIATPKVTKPTGNPVLAAAVADQRAYALPPATPSVLDDLISLEEDEQIVQSKLLSSVSEFCATMKKEQLLSSISRSPSSVCSSDSDYESIHSPSSDTSEVVSTEKCGAGPCSVAVVKECVNHVCKRLGTRLRNLKDLRVATVTSRDRTVQRSRLAGKAGLTDTVTEKLATQFGQNVLLKRILQVYVDLTRSELLLRCWKKRTQNPNKNLHSKLCLRCSKVKKAHLSRVTFAATDTALVYNFGYEDSSLLVRLGLGLQEPKRNPDSEGTPTRRTPKRCRV